MSHQGILPGRQVDHGASPALCDPTSALADCLLKNDGLVHLCILCSVEKRDALPGSTPSKCIQPRHVLAQFRAVAGTKLGPAFRIVPEPSSQLTAGCKLAQPVIQRGIPLSDAARPDPIDEKAHAIRPLRLIVDPLDANVRLTGRCGACVQLLRPAG